MKLKNDFFMFYFSNTDCSFTILIKNMKLLEYLDDVLLEGSVSHFFDIGLC